MDGWTLVGARMVELHALEHGRAMHRLSADADALGNARLRPNPVRRLAEVLVSDSFEIRADGMEGIGHAFVRGRVEIDVLAPERLGARSQKARTTVPPLHTVEVPGGTQALDRTRRVPVRLGDEIGELPRPDLLGAILIKARAVDIDDVPDAQRQDLALLLSLAVERQELNASISAAERTWLRARDELDDPEHPAWARLTGDERSDGLATFRLLAGSSPVDDRR
ncbi:MAG TPA: hypothetical protein VFM93_09015 [Candidatus Limnocylindria bacterium]|nr:hypothetical protein [Candidatus Limnocylindria bacterium]